MEDYTVPEDRIWFREASGWPREVPKNIDIPDLTLDKVMEETVMKYQDRNSMWFIDSWMTYREMGDHVDRFATALHRMGVKKGDCVALVLPNSYQYVISFYACLKLGVVVTGVNPTYKPLEVLHQLKITVAVGIICLDALYDTMIDPIIAKSDVEWVIWTNVVDLVNMSELKKWLGKIIKKIPTGPVRASALRFKDLIDTKPAVPTVEIDPYNDPAAYMMTGGTTGVPKAAVLTHFNLVANAMQIGAWVYAAKPGACGIAILPFFHAYGMTCLNIGLYKGWWAMTFPRPPQMDELCEKIVTLVGDEGVFFPGAEVLFKRLTDFENIDKYDLAGKLECCISSAGPLHRPIQEKFEKITSAKLVEAYGLTEASPGVSAVPFFGKRKIGTIGLPFPSTDWMIVDPTDYTKELEPGKDNVGELAVRGPQVMKGYLNRPEETAETLVTIKGKTWLLTGDIGYMDEDGQVVLLDRKKQLIKYKGFSVFPKEIEELVGGHEGVSEVAAAGIPHEDFGEVIKIWVVLTPGFKGKLTGDQLKNWCKENMTHYKVPYYVEFRDEIPKNLIGKVQRRELQEADPQYQKVRGKTDNR